MDGKPVSRVDKGDAVPNIENGMVRRLAKSEQDLIPSLVSVTSFDRPDSKDPPLGLYSRKDYL